jgi:threonine/homoserine/homoserine lactone efflux protein
MTLLLFLFAFALGVVAAIPVGACQIEVAKRAMAGHLRASLLVVAGSATSDLIYGGIALFGIAPVLQVPSVLAAFSAAAAFILWLLAYRTWLESRKPHELDLHESLASGRWALVTGFLLGMSNPPIILSWLFGAAVATRIGLAPVVTHSAKLNFVVGGALGLAAYLIAMSFVTHRMRHFLSTRTLGRVYSWLAVTLLVLSLYFVHGVWVYFRRVPAGG